MLEPHSPRIAHLLRLCLSYDSTKRPCAREALDKLVLAAAHLGLLEPDPEGEPISPLTVERVASVLRCQHLCASEADALSVARALNPPLGPSCRDVGRVVQALGDSLRLTPCPKYHLWKTLCVPPLAPVRVVERRPSCIRVSVVGLWEVHDVKSTCTLLEVTVQGRGAPSVVRLPVAQPSVGQPPSVAEHQVVGLGPGTQVSFRCRPWVADPLLDATFAWSRITSAATRLPPRAPAAPVVHSAAPNSLKLTVHNSGYLCDPPAAALVVEVVAEAGTLPTRFVTVPCAVSQQHVEVTVDGLFPCVKYRLRSRCEVRPDDRPFLDADIPWSDFVTDETPSFSMYNTLRALRDENTDLLEQNKVLKRQVKSLMAAVEDMDGTLSSLKGHVTYLANKVHRLSSRLRSDSD